MSERNPGELTRQPRAPSAGGSDIAEEHELTPEEALAQAKEQIEQANNRAAQAQREATEAAAQRDRALKDASGANADALSSRERSILSAMDTQKTAVDQAKQAIAMAQAAGDAVSVAEAFDRLADARGKLNQLSSQKEWFDSERERLKNAPPQQQQGAPTGHRIVTASGTVIQANDAVKDWADRHPRFSSDREYEAAMITAHTMAVNSGIQEGSPAYFRELDNAATKYERLEALERGEQQPQERLMNTRQQRPASSMAAPVTRGQITSSSRSGEPNALDVARQLGVTETDLREFARINGYKGEEGFKAYLKGHQEVLDIQRAGGNAGLKTDGVYR